jgi:hypothetical protein
MIYGFFGSIPGCPHNRGNHALRGNGKTLCLTFVGYVDSLRGRRVISNYKTSFSEYVPVEEIARMVVEDNIRDTTILITEMQVYLNSLGVNSNDLKEFIGSVIGQSRKRNTDIHYDTQRYGDIHPRLRVQTDRAFLPRKFHVDGEPCHRDRCKESHVIYLFQHDPYLHEEVIRLKAEAFADLYNTDEIIAVPMRKSKRRKT